MKSSPLLLALLAALVVLVPAASARVGTTEPTEEVRVIVHLTDTGIKMTPKSAPRGAVALFTVYNKGKKPHSFAVGEGLGTAMQANITYKKGLATPTIKPNGKVRILLIFLDIRGQLPVQSTVPADLKNPRMRSFFTIR
jgi:hypothetical protein